MRSIAASKLGDFQPPNKAEIRNYFMAYLFSLINLEKAKQDHPLKAKM